ncbi:MAG: creatininase family protein [Gemmatimonadetes bacterium]|nr:creatininase family protein [Gemmatimonadota bacterium]
MSLHLERMTSPEAGDAIAAGRSTAVFACGAVEQHGPHLPMFTDAEHGTRLAEEVARRLGDALVAPTIRIGCSEHHMTFAGSLSIRPGTLEALCTDYCTSLARHGFTRIAIIPSHGGNFKPLASMLGRLRESVATGCAVHAYTDLVGFMHVWKQAVAAAGAPADRVGGHADIAESSIMLALHPSLVHVDRAAEGFRPVIDDTVIARIFSEGFHRVTPNGILGDARGMSADIGERCIAAAADHLARFFREAFETP